MARSAFRKIRNVTRRDRVQAIDATMAHLKARIGTLPVQQTLLIRLIRVLDQSLNTLLARAITPHGFTEATLHTLMLVSCMEEQELTAGTLCDLVAQTPQNMTRILQLLCDQGYLERVADERDGRRSRLLITDAGRDCLAAVLPATIVPVRAGFQGLTQAEQRTLEKLLRKSIESLDRAALGLAVAPPAALKRRASRAPSGRSTS